MAKDNKRAARPKDAAAKNAAEIQGLKARWDEITADGSAKDPLVAASIAVKLSGFNNAAKLGYGPQSEVLVKAEGFMADFFEGATAERRTEQVYLNYIRVLSAREKYSEAQGFINKGRKNFPSSKPLLMEDIRNALGGAGDVSSILEKAVASGTFEEGTVRRAMIDFAEKSALRLKREGDAGKSNKVIDGLMKLTDWKADDKKALELAGDYAMQSKSFERAEEIYKRCMTAFPDKSLYSYKFIRALMGQDNPAKKAQAQQLTKLGLMMDPDSPALKGIQHDL